MDTYCEQLVRMKKGAKFYFGIFGLFFALLIISLLSLVFLRMLSAVIIVAAGYGVYYLAGFLSVEYEYIITNGTIDIDIIYSKRSRKRIASFELSGVESIEKCNGLVPDKNKYKNVVVACDPKDSSAYKLIISNDSGVFALVIMPDERTRQEIIKFVPKFIGNTAFK